MLKKEAYIDGNLGRAVDPRGQISQLQLKQNIVRWFGMGLSVYELLRKRKACNLKKARGM
jgi:hypothetical protein